MARKRSGLAREPVKAVLPMYTPDRFEALRQLTKALWEEMRRSLGAMRQEIEAMPAGGEAPVFSGRARVKLMQGALRALEPDVRELVQSACDEIEAWRWQDELAQAMERWIQQFKRDVAEYGVAPDGVEDEDGEQYPVGFQEAFERFVEVYDDWQYVASRLAIIEAHGIEASEIKRTDVALRRIEQRAMMRRSGAGEREQ